jgi:hypothetical protein
MRVAEKLPVLATIRSTENRIARIVTGHKFDDINCGYHSEMIIFQWHNVLTGESLNIG